MAVRLFDVTEPQPTRLRGLEAAPKSRREVRRLKHRYAFIGVAALAVPFVAALVSAAVMAAEDKLGRDTVVLDLRDLVDSFDALVVASGRNDRQVRAIAEEVERLVAIALDVKPIHVEGWSGAEWIALDYGDVIVHVFDE